MPEEKAKTWASQEQLTIATAVARLRQLRKQSHEDRALQIQRLIDNDLPRLEALLLPETKAWMDDLLECCKRIAAEPKED
jgi:hypothetical protein